MTSHQRLQFKNRATPSSALAHGYPTYTNARTVAQGLSRPVR